MRNLYYLTLIFLVAGQYTAILKSGGTNLYLFDLAVFLFATVGFLYFLLVYHSFKIPKNSVFYLLFLLVTVISFIWNAVNYPVENIVTAVFYLIRYQSYLLSGIVVFNMIDKKNLTKIEIFNSLIYSGIVLSFVGFILMILIPDFGLLDPSLGWDPHKNRLNSTFFDPNFTGAYLVGCIILLMNRIYVSSPDKKLTVKDYFSFIILILGIFLSFSRSAWGMLGIVIFVFGLFRSKNLLLISSIVIFAAYFAIPRVQTRITGTTDPADSASFRFISWTNTLTIARDYPVSGVGFNFYRYVQKDYGYLSDDTFYSHGASGSDSSFLFVLVTTGIIGMTLFMLAYIYPMIDISANRELKLAMMGSFFLGSFFNNLLFYPQIMFLWFLVVISCSFSHT